MHLGASLRTAFRTVLLATHSASPHKVRPRECLGRSLLAPCPFAGRLEWLCVGMDQRERKRIATAGEDCEDEPQGTSGTERSGSSELTLFDDYDFDRTDRSPAVDPASVPTRRNPRRSQPLTTPDDDAVAESRTLLPRLVSVIEAARLLGVGRSTLYELMGNGDLKVVHIGRSARIPVGSVDAFVARLQSAGEADNQPRPPAIRIGKASRR